MYCLASVIVDLYGNLRLSGSGEILELFCFESLKDIQQRA
jgi:hypothetical protein